MLLDNDYKCELRNSVYFCAANTNQSLGLYQTLQERLRVVATTMASYRQDVPRSLATLTSDGRIGPTTALAAQVVLAAFHRLVPMPEPLLPILSDSATGEEIIRLVAQQADLVLAYIDDTLIKYPDIMRPQQLRVPQVTKRPGMSKAGWLAVGSAVIVTGGLLLVARSSQRASDGKNDRSQFLPPPTPDELAEMTAEDDESDDSGDENADVEDAEIVEDDDKERRR